MGERVYAFPAMQEETLSNGLSVIWLPDHEQETLTVALQFPFGRFHDPAGQEGLCELTVGLLQKGTRSMPCETFSEKLEYTGSSLFSEVGEEHVVLGCRMLLRFAEQVVPLFWEMIREPAMAAAELKTLQKELLTALHAEANEPSSIAGRHLHARVFGSAHPAGRSHTVASVKRITLDRVRSFHARFLAPGHALVVVAGALRTEEMMRRWRSSFESWAKRGEEAEAVTAPDLAADAAAIRLIDKPDLTQTTIVGGHLVPGEVYERRDELALANYVLGGGHFSSRLMAEVRSRLGKAYAVSSQIACVRNTGIFSISTSTLNNQVGGMLQAIRDVYERFASQGLTEEEFQKARQFVVGNLAFQLEGIDNVTEKLLWLRFYGRGNEYIEHFAERVKALDLETTNAVLREHLQPRRLTVCAVGARKQIQAQLEQFGRVECVHFRSKA